MIEFTPSTEQVRAHYVFNQSDHWDAERGKDFDRWLVAHDAEKQAQLVSEIATAIRAHATAPSELANVATDLTIEWLANWIESPPEWVHVSYRRES